MDDVVVAEESAEGGDERESEKKKLGISEL
jgi:hypothetical protein